MLTADACLVVILCCPSSWCAVWYKAQLFYLNIIKSVCYFFFLGSKNTDAVFCACLKASLSQSECKIEENANIVICFMNYINVHFF